MVLTPEYCLPMLLMYDFTTVDWYEGIGKMVENPPPDKLAAVSGVPEVPPTEVTLRNRQDAYRKEVKR